MRFLCFEIFPWLNGKPLGVLYVTEFPFANSKYFFVAFCASSTFSRQNTFHSWPIRYISVGRNSLEIFRRRFSLKRFNNFRRLNYELLETTIFATYFKRVLYDMYNFTLLCVFANSVHGSDKGFFVVNMFLTSLLTWWPLHILCSQQTHTFYG